jgi:NADP-dependent 3-hydroxy acid dehydrogenase YdfG
MNTIKNILITGASSGIGEALALHYAKNGAKTLFLCGRNKERLDNVAEACRKVGADVHAKVLDVTDKEKVATWIKSCNKKARLNLVFANAGVSTGEETPENIYNTFNINIFGVLNTLTPTIELYKKLDDSAPRIVAITASIAGYHGLVGCPSYSASKACVKAYGEAMRLRLAKENIQLNVICPGFVRSRITDKNTCPMPFFMEADNAAEIIAKRIEKNVGLIAFPWPMRLVAWLGSILPNCISNFIYSRIPYKV